jgi:methylthioribulose-1-phosphate dehydratase
MMTALPTNTTPTLAEARIIVVEMCRRMYQQGFVGGTGGGMAVRVHNQIVMAPSGVHKELLHVDDMFLCNLDGEVMTRPASSALALTQCAPLFVEAMQQRGAGGVIHSHSQHAVMATLHFQDVVEITHMEMLKGLRGVAYADVHRIPIIDNTAHECDLRDSLADAIRAHPLVHAVLVRRHGIYVWGADWLEAKRHAEVYDYLLQLAVQMKLAKLSMTPG